MRVIYFVALAIASAIQTQCVDAAPAYKATPLGTLGGTLSSGFDINNSGQITGQSYLPGNLITHAFLHANGAMVDLGTLGGPHSYGKAINDNGQVTGLSDVPSNGGGHAFLYAAGHMLDLGGMTIAGQGINTAGHVVGSMDTAGAGHAFVYRGGPIIDLGTFGGDTSSAIGINNLGQVTGLARLSGNMVYHAFIYSGTGLIDIHSGPGNYSAGNAINGIGHVAGEFFSGDPTTQEHAFLYTGGAMLDLGTLGGSYSSARGINDGGLVTGISKMPGNVDEHAFLYANGTLHDLNALVTSGLDGAMLVDAAGINDSGQIAATGCKGSTCQAFRLDPDGDIGLPVLVNVVEYRNAAFDHYFMTPVLSEIAMLDARTPPFQDWSRTGWSFHAYPGLNAPTESVHICRFFNDTFAPKSSHFYAPVGFGCETTIATFPDWRLEDDHLFNTALPDAAGVCPQGTVPLYRLYNSGMGGAPNHRYVTDLSERQKMLAKGYIAEGAGIGVGMCVPI